MPSSWVVVLLVVGLAATSAEAGPLTLTGTIRDFLPHGTAAGTHNGHAGQGHPDFERYLGADPEVVLSTLGAGGKPVFNPAATTATDATFFDMWFNDTPGYNLSVSHGIDLTETWAGSGVYEYESEAFFPVDGQLYGNNPALGHNYGFTFELHGTFGYQPGQLFAFEGDDDLFVFIDGLLALNLGGVHPSQAAVIDLATLGLTPGQNYAIDIFFAERHTVQSVFKIQTSIPFEQLVAEPEPVPAPEPASLLMLGTGLIGTAAAIRRRRAARSAASPGRDLSAVARRAKVEAPVRRA